MCWTCRNGGRGIHADRAIARAERVTITCAQCGQSFTQLASFVRIHNTKFCSKRCADASTRKPESKAEVVCATCGRTFSKRRDHLKPLNYCSPACTQASRRVDGAKWRDTAQIKAYMREYIARNRDAHNARGRAWAKANPVKKLATHHARRARLKEGSFTAADWLAILDRYGHACAHCHRKDRIEIDHIIPLAAGGRNDASNIQPLCRSCNARKGARVPVHGIEITEIDA